MENEDSWITASQAARKINNDTLTSTRLVTTSLAAIEDRDQSIKAFACVSGESALETAGKLDQRVERGLLHGIPIAIKDVFDTADMPTEFNSPHYPANQPTRNAACVEVLVNVGAVIVGKATTVEFASLGRVPATVNPHDHTRTPGGSSSGSAAAVAAGMVPLAIGTQTGGSTIRPASFCGVAAMKPTYGTVPVEGLRPYAPGLDTVGWMSRSVEDLALLAKVFRVSLFDAGLKRHPPTIGFYKTPYWEMADRDTRAALDCAIAALNAAGATVAEVAGPPGAARLNEAQDVIMHGEGRAAFLAESLRWPDQLHPAFRDEVSNAMGLSGETMRWAHDYLGAMRPDFDEAMADFDAWLTPAVPGEAPVGLSETGDAVFNRLWTGLHMPCITLPGFRGGNGMPVGIQLVAPRYRDAVLLEVARFAEAAFSAAPTQS